MKNRIGVKTPKYQLSMFSLLFILIGCWANCQSIGIGTATPDTSALVDFKSNNKGIIIPRLTQTQIRNLLPSQGMVLFNITDNKPMYYDGIYWKFFNDSIMPIQTGDKIAGGFVFYVDATGKHGLAATLADVTTSIEWGCFGVTTTATGTANGTGQANTTKIISLPCGSSNTAAALCDNLVLNGFSDWFLPSKDEIRLLILALNTKGYFPYTPPGILNRYWSSSEYADDRAWQCIISTAFDGASIVNDYWGKSGTYRVRAVRKF
jgi:Protein of unknown function (DUF1566)